LWDLTTGAEVHRFTGHTGGIQSVAYAPDGSTVLTGSYDKTARLRDARTGAELCQFTGHTEYIKDVAFAPDGRTKSGGSSTTSV
jgi:WD40 repeat protein